MELKEILALMAKKYPTNYMEGQNPALLIYDDESGRISNDATRPYDSTLFDFSSIEELVAHLQGE